MKKKVTYFLYVNLCTQRDDIGMSGKVLSKREKKTIALVMLCSSVFLFISCLFQVYKFEKTISGFKKKNGVIYEINPVSKFDVNQEATGTVYVVKYQYKINGLMYNGEYESNFKPYKHKNSNIYVYVDPSNPEKAYTIEKNLNTYIPGLVFSLIIMVSSIIIIVIGR